MKGIKGTTQLDTKVKKKPQQKRGNRYVTVDPPERVEICKNCTKPASMCKGACFGKD